MAYFDMSSDTYVSQGYLLNEPYNEIFWIGVLWPGIAGAIDVDKEVKDEGD